MELPYAVGAYDFTTARLIASAAALLALGGVVAASLALARTAGRLRSGNARTGARVALVASPVGAVLGTVVVVTADGGLGTGNGLGGGVVALLLGLVGTALGRRALNRSLRPVG
ncbi:DUF6223 family protein [Streptomyces sp. NPDC051921]|uniref:DUF6223 family protein n=1 Tax=Streptomyces sp. NPDC051921 TaxID=3155806 RepID=UPI003444041A